MRNQIGNRHKSLLVTMINYELNLYHDFLRDHHDI